MAREGIVQSLRNMFLSPQLAKFSFPGSYDEAKLRLVQWIKENPEHFVLELFLVVFIAYILLVKRAYDPAKRYVTAH